MVTKELKKEASTAGAIGGSKVSDIKGFSAPFGRVPKSKKGRKKKNPSKPFGEAELFENAMAHALLDEDDIGEVVKKRGDMWVYHDDETGAEKGAWKERDAAWEKQRADRKVKSAKKKSERGRSQEKALIPAVEKPKKEPKQKPKLAKKPKKAPPAKKEPKKRRPKVRRLESLDQILNFINEGSMMSYVFENTPIDDESVTWEKFVSRLSKQTVFSDPKLKKILQDMAKAEGKLLEKAVAMIDGVLKQTGKFDVSAKKVEIDPATKDVKLNFVVDMKESKQKLTFAVKLENGRPLLLFPNETKAMLNSMEGDDSKLLRAELMHSQETVLDNMEDVVTVTGRRDKYLKQLEKKVDKFLNSVTPVEISMLRYLLKNKYKGVR
jgi:hypothetical protein